MAGKKPWDPHISLVSRVCMGVLQSVRRLVSSSLVILPTTSLGPLLRRAGFLLIMHVAPHEPVVCQAPPLHLLCCHRSIRTRHTPVLCGHSHEKEYQWLEQWRTRLARPAAASESRSMWQNGKERGLETGAAQVGFHWR